MAKKLESVLTPQLFELTTKSGHKFLGGSSVIIGDNTYDMATLTETQHRYVIGQLNEQGLNAAFAGCAIFKAERVPIYEEAFGGQ